jgi:hypothetical protein
LTFHAISGIKFFFNIHYIYITLPQKKGDKKRYSI